MGCQPRCDVTYIRTVVVVVGIEYYYVDSTYCILQTGVVTTATAVSLGGCLAVTSFVVHYSSTSVTSLPLSYGVVGLCGELIAMLSLVSHNSC